MFHAGTVPFNSTGIIPGGVALTCESQRLKTADCFCFFMRIPWESTDLPAMTGAAFAGDVRELGAALELLAQVAPLLVAELAIARDEEDEAGIDDRPSEGVPRDATEVRSEEVMSSHAVELSIFAVDLDSSARAREEIRRAARPGISSSHVEMLQEHLHGTQAPQVVEVQEAPVRLRQEHLHAIAPAGPSRAMKIRAGTRAES
jgi:hypothetical protein